MGNPALSQDIFTREPVAAGAEVMTLRGTIARTLILLGLATLGAATIWNRIYNTPGDPLVVTALWASLILGFILAIITIFKKTWAGVTGPLYALVKGVALGALTALFELAWPGIAIQAVALTGLVLFAMLALYGSGVIKVTQTFRAGVVAATGAVFLFYLIGIGLSFFGVAMPLLHSTGPLGIGLSLVIIGIAALNLVLDFDHINQGVQRGAPKYMEWYAAFGLMVTLVWLYLEMLRLLAKVRSR